MAGMPETHDDCLTTDRAARRWVRSWKAACAASLLVLTAAFPVHADSAQKDIKAYFAVIPEVVFDETTEGLDDEGRKLLLQKGESPDWTYKRLHAGKATLTGVHPHTHSVVTMQLMNLGRPVLQVHIQNEKRETISYWLFAALGEQLEAYQPRSALMAAAAAHHDLEFNRKARSSVLVNPLAGVPAEIVAHVDAREACRKLAGEARGDIPKEQVARLLQSQQALRCDQASAVEEELRRKHAKLPVARAILDRAKAIIGD
ncbi:MAG: hypothetical protein ACRCUE_03685 [Bosea sp. (in: a-proteobacteria)]